MSDGIQTLGVLGAGQMGAGITQVAALAGYKVFLNDLSDEGFFFIQKMCNGTTLGMSMD